MPINLTGTLMNVMGTWSSIKTAANTDALNKRQEEIENWEGDDWSQAPQGSKQQIAYQKASDTYYGDISEKSLQNERRRYLKEELQYTGKGRPSEYQRNEADKYMTSYLSEKTENAPQNIQSKAEELLMSPRQKAQLAYDHFHEYLKKTYGGKQDEQE